MPYLYECSCGKAVGLEIKADFLQCSCGKKPKPKEVDREEFRKTFPVKVRRREK